MLFCLASDVVETEFLFIFVQINKGKQLFIPLANRGNFIRRLLEPGMAVVSTVLCLDLRIGAGTGTGRFSCSGSLKPALRGTDLRFFAGNKAARSLFRGGVRRCITVGISDEIPVLPSRLDFRGGGWDSCRRSLQCDASIHPSFGNERQKQESPGKNVICDA